MKASELSRGDDMITESQIKSDPRKTPVSTKRPALQAVRIFRPKLEVKRCKRLYGCYVFCPENSIIIEKGYPKIRYETCTGCLICVRECKCRSLIEEREHG